MKKIFTAAGTVALFASALIPALAAGNNCSNGTTGPFSTNYCDITNTSSVSVENVNDAQIKNDVTAEVNTGGNSASYNTLGGQVVTGEASLQANIANVANVNTTTVSGGPVGGVNIAGNSITGPFSDNRADIYNSQRVYVENSNTATVENNVSALSDTGNNATDYNTGPGIVDTGRALLHVGVTTHVNDSATDISAGSGGTGSNTVDNSTTGPFSVNYADITNKARVSVKNISDALIGNWVEAVSNTGANSASYTTLGGSVQSGSATGDIGVDSTGNVNTTLVSMAMGGFGNDAGNSLTGPESDNRNEILNKQKISVENWNNKCRSHNADRIGETSCDPSELGVFTYDYDVSDSGNNVSDYNTGGGGILSGWTELVKSIATHLNDTLTVIH